MPTDWTMPRRDVLRLAGGMLAGAAAGGALLDRSRALAQTAVEKPIDEALIKAAQKEGTVTYYHTTTIDQTNAWHAAFTKKYGVEVKPLRMVSFLLYDRWLNEERVGRHVADLIQILDPTLLTDAGAQGFLENYVPAGSVMYDEGMKKEGVWYAINGDVLGIGYNSNKVTPEEEAMIRKADWDTLGDPRWKGRFCTGSPSAGASSYVAVYMFLATFKDKYGEPFLKKLAANKPDIFASKSPMYDRIAAGEYSITDQGAQQQLSELYLKGAPVRWVFPDPTPTFLVAQGISKNAPHPNAAKLFQEWCCSRDGQMEWFKYIAAISPRRDVVDPRQTAHQGWFGEPWYNDPKRLYLDYLTEPAFQDPKKPLIPVWNEIFGYQGK